MTLRVYLRRSRAEEGKQEFSLDVQRQGCAAFVSRLSVLLGAKLGRPVEYVDDGIAGDDFVGRAGLARLMADAKKGDVIVARDQSRIGRNALEVTVAITQLTQDKGTRVFYCSDGQEARCDNVISQTMTFIRGVGGQMELEALRSRTREGLRARARRLHRGRPMLRVPKRPRERRFGTRANTDGGRAHRGRRGSTDLPRTRRGTWFQADREKPEWRIIDDQTWFAVQAMGNARVAGRAPGPRCKYPLTGLVRCGHCGGSVGVVSKRVGTTNVQAYACSYHHYRGSAACAVSVRQPRTEVEVHLVDYVREKVLGPAVEDQIVARVQAEVERRLEGPSIDTRGLEAELAKLEREKANLVGAIAAGGDVDELVEAVKARKAAIAGIQSRLAASKAAPETLRRTREVCEPYVRSRLAELRELIVQPSEDARRGCGLSSRKALYFSQFASAGATSGGPQATAKIAAGRALRRSHWMATPAGFEPAFMP